MTYSPAESPCISKNKSYSFWSYILPPLLLRKCVYFQALIWTLYAFDIQINLHVQNMKYLFWKAQKHIWAGYPPALFPFWSSALSSLFRNLMPPSFLHILLKYFIPSPKPRWRSSLDISRCAYLRLFSINCHYVHQVCSIGTQLLCHFQPNTGCILLISN